MPEPTAALHALRASTADLVRGLDIEHWSDDDVRAPSLCEGWTRAHVLTHIARNADGIAATLAGALRGEVVARYPDARYPDGRDTAIEDGATRPVSALVADVAESAERLDRVMAALSDADRWQRPTDGGRHAAEWVFPRVREVEIHRVDLGGSYTPDRWPPLLVAELLPLTAASLADRCDRAVRVEVAAEGCVVAELAGTVWEAGAGEPADVTGPDWAILAWLVGRETAAKNALTTTPTLAPWR